jgi:hypothetical protein
MEDLPDFKKGIDYWTAVDATVDGVLGGFGEGVRIAFLGRLSRYLNQTKLSFLKQTASSPCGTTLIPSLPALPYAATSIILIPPLRTDPPNTHLHPDQNPT